MPTTPTADLIPAWNDQLQGKSAIDILRWSAETIGDNITFATSLGAEDQVLTHMLAETGIPCRVFTLDTGRLFQETYDLLEETQERYGINIDICFPETDDVKEMVSEHGINLFRQSVEMRKLCCGIRKINPLRQALAPADAWISGLRRDQSVTRTEIGYVEWDGANEMAKLNPLCDWSQDDVWDYIREHNIPYNPLHDKGFLSIGCASCTRAVAPGEDIRAGRWWWESPEHKECGIHIQDGKVIRVKPKKDVFD